MIFAAGIGSRLKPFTLTHPKALAPVARRPALQWAIDNLGNTAVDKIVVNAHHFAEQVKDYINGITTEKLPIEISDESLMLLDTGGGLLKAAPLLDSDNAVWLHNADIVTNLDLGQMAREFASTGPDALLLVADRGSSRRLWFERRTNRLVGWQNTTTGQTRPENFTPDTKTQYAASFGGIHLVNLPRLMPLLTQYSNEHGPAFSLTPFYIWAADRLDIRAYTPAAPYRWFDIGTPEKLAACNAAFADTTGRP